jgi:diacylglycerol O-acyltransferase / wax synthase
VDRLTSIDASFLAQERDGSHMHIGGVLLFGGEAPTKDELAEHIESRLHLVPRYRHKLSFPRFEMGRPLWVEDSSFNIGYHVRHTALPAPGSVEQLRLLVSRIFSQRLDRSKPLWELWLVEGYEGGFAIVSKVHHAVVDGVSGADLTTVLFDLSEEGTDVPPPESPWSPAPEPSGAQVVAKGAADLAGAPVGLAKRALGAVTDPSQAVGRAREAASGIGEIAWGAVNSAPQTPLNGPIGPHRRVTWVRMPLADLKEIKNALGGTVNDVFLATVAGALHNWLRSRGLRTEGLEIRSAVPVSVRAEGAGSELGNQITVMVGKLPTYVPDPVERLRVVSESMKGLKESKQALGAQAIAGVEDFAPPTIFARASRLHFSNRMYNLLTTNVPGPQFPLYLLGREMKEMLPVAFLAPGQRLAIACMSYNGTVALSMIGDYDAMPDLEQLSDLVTDEVAALREAAESVTMPATG